MVRFLIALTAAAAIALGVGYYFGWLGNSSTGNGTGSNNAIAKKDYGDYLYPPAADPVLGPRGPGRVFDPIVIAAQLQPNDKQEVSAQLAGQILFVGEEIPIGAQLVAGVAPFLPDPCNVAKIRFEDVELVKGTNGVTSKKYAFRDYSFIYRRVIKGETVSKDQMVAMLNPAKALAEKRAKIAKTESAQAEYRAADATTNEAKANLDRLLSLPVTSRSEYDIAVAKVTYLRAKEEGESKYQAIKQAAVELEQAMLALRFHDVPNNLAGRYGVVKEVYRERGESVKEQDKIVELQSLESFMAEGLMDAQYLKHVKEGMRVTIEPTQEESRTKIFKAHRGEITGVAFTNDPANPQVVSASEDRTVLVWDRKYEIPVHYFPHDDPVRSLACSPPGAGHNIILSGCSDGSIYLWDLTNPTPTPKKLAGKERAHHDAVTCLAISPDGKFFASGGADHQIKLWNLDACRKGDDQAELIYDLDAEHGATPHNGAITALSFTPQCRLVSASRDNTLRVWALKQKGVEPVGSPIAGRNGSVPQLGVSSDGHYMLYDQSKALQILSVADGRTLYTLQHPGGTTAFETLALFSPDSSLLLTAGANEGRLSLWSVPGPNSRGFEVRQFAAEEHSPVTCAAFAPQKPVHDKGTLAVSGTKDGYVYLWPVPSADDVKHHPIRNVYVTTVNTSVEITTRQVGVRVGVRNQFSPQYPNGRLIPGRPVTIVIEP